MPAFPLTNLTALNLMYKGLITDAGLATLIKMVRLRVGYEITDAVVQRLTNLTSLATEFNVKITDAGLAHLSSLSDISIGSHSGLSDVSVAQLFRLASLSIKVGLPPCHFLSPRQNA
jgi:hypothetical protein